MLILMRKSMKVFTVIVLLKMRIVGLPKSIKRSGFSLIQSSIKEDYIGNISITRPNKFGLSSQQYDFYKDKSAVNSKLFLSYLQIKCLRIYEDTQRESIYLSQTEFVLLSWDNFSPKSRIKTMPYERICPYDLLMNLS